MPLPTYERKRFLRVKQPKKGHPLVLFLFAEMQRQRIGVLEMATKSGVNKLNFKNWRLWEKTPTLPTIEAALGVLGFSLEPVAHEPKKRYDAKEKALRIAFHALQKIANTDYSHIDMQGHELEEMDVLTAQQALKKMEKYLGPDDEFKREANAGPISLRDGAHMDRPPVARP